MNNADSNFSLNIDINVDEPGWHTHLSNITDLIYDISYNTFNTLNCTKYLRNIEFSVTLINNEEIQLLNNTYRHRDKATNVLSFPVQDIDPENITNLAPHYLNFILLGDIIMALEVINEEAITQNKTFSSHFSHLLVHGILHLMGYTHDNDQTAEKMEKLEIAVLSNFGIQSPYMCNK
ncbi:putative rRNA maturation factor [Rickettsiales bacterium Ac37b]|nr:putative rRNA maturation factor [Rickettsiales bacterium Ac37b]